MQLQLGLQRVRAAFELLRQISLCCGLDYAVHAWSDLSPKPSTLDPGFHSPCPGCCDACSTSAAITSAESDRARWEAPGSLCGIVLEQCIMYCGLNCCCCCCCCCCCRLRLKQFFPFTLIDAMGSLEETRQQITNELRYQSSLDLNAKAYELIRHLPLAKDVVLSARQELVMRLDGYCEASFDLFAEVVDRIINDVLPVVRQSGLAGHAEYVTRSSFFTEHPVAIDMLVDVMTDRGFHVCYIREDTAIPEHVDLSTGAIRYALRPCHKFRISFDARGPRDEMKALEIAARMTESQASLQRDVRISHSVIPEHFADARTAEEAEEAARDKGHTVAGFMGP
eukprot:GHRQ01010720.1.p2 GENE.GHRQ01010720.1~~GHRQ01010720.1.p2  ORF type:complete len:339 (+),score=123.54 GHRQ01010720.1:1335-2351(+)